MCERRREREIKIKREIDCVRGEDACTPTHIVMDRQRKNIYPSSFYFRTLNTIYAFNGLNSQRTHLRRHALRVSIFLVSTTLFLCVFSLSSLE